MPVLKAGRQITLMLAGLGLSLTTWFGSTACGVKKTVEIEVPSKIIEAKSATFDELLDLLRGYDKISSLACNNMRVDFVTGDRARGELQDYRDARGYILLQRPASLHWVLQLPITKTTLIDLLSVGDDFKMWYPRKRQFFIGKNSYQELIAEEFSEGIEFTARPEHIFQAILPKSIELDSENTRVVMKESIEEAAKYYVLSVSREVGEFRQIPIRDIWIERSGLIIEMQQTYLETGEISSIIRYSEYVLQNGLSLPLKIQIDRPLDEYTLDLEFEAWRINPKLPEKAFILTPPPEAQLIQFKEKGRSAIP